MCWCKSQSKDIWLCFFVQTSHWIELNGNIFWKFPDRTLLLGPRSCFEILDLKKQLNQIKSLYDFLWISCSESESSKRCIPLMKMFSSLFKVREDSISCYSILSNRSLSNFVSSVSLSNLIFEFFNFGESTYNLHLIWEKAGFSYEEQNKRCFNVVIWSCLSCHMAEF